MFSKLAVPLVLIVAALGYFLLKPSAQPDTGIKSLALPWQIQVNGDGTASVFGITPERTTVSELLDLWGEDHELAIISDSEDRNGLEIYYSHFNIGPLQAKLIANVSADSKQLEAMQAAASSSSYTGSGSRKFLLNENDLKQIQNWVIDSLSYLPSARLDEGIILDRFGKPQQRIADGEGVEHFLYPEKGLDIVLNTEGKELLQYVAPRSFDKLTKPLEALQEKTAESP